MEDRLGNVDLTGLLFERLPASVAVLDTSMCVYRYNGAWARAVALYSPVLSGEVTPGWRLFDLLPGTQETLAPLFERALAGETVERQALPLESGGVVSYWDLALSPIYDDGEIVGVLDIASEVTSQVTVNGTRGLASLLDLAQDAAATLELEPLLYKLLDFLKRFVDYDGATFLQREGDDLVILAHRGPIDPREQHTIRFPYAAAASRETILYHKTIIVPDIQADTPLARAYRLSGGPHMARFFGYVRSWLAVPLVVKDRVIGLLSLDHSQPNAYTPQHARLALGFANQVAIFIENARLYAETRQRADEIQTLYTVQQAIIRRLDPDAVLQMIADEARRLTNTEMGAVYLCDGEDLVISVVSGKVSQRLLGYRIPASSSVAGHAVATCSSRLVADASTNPEVNEDIVNAVGAHSFIIVPLISGDKAFGTITVANKQSGALGQEDERVLAMLASGASIALENARLFASLEQRTQELEALYRADEELYRNLELDDVLGALVDVTAGILAADKCSVMVWDEAQERLRVRAQHGFNPETVAQMSFRPGEGLAGSVVQEGALVVVEDVEGEPRVARRITDAEGIRSFMHVPLRISDRIFGVFNVSYCQPRAFGEEAQRLFVALAQRAALVIENARLYEHAQAAAAAEERNRLARELHDAVTQTLFSASLIADVLPRIWERDVTQGQARLQELRELTRGALAEMRALLLELRPATLLEISLSELLRQLADALIGRSRLPITLELHEVPELPPSVQVALYRIAQESLNNVVKHAGASAATIKLAMTGDGLILRIEDDGCGFGPEHAGHDSLGLSIMRERAEGIGARLAIASQPSRGTTVTVCWAPDGVRDEEPSLAGVDNWNTERQDEEK